MFKSSLAIPTFYGENSSVVAMMVVIAIVWTLQIDNATVFLSIWRETRIIIGGNDLP